MRKQDRIHQQQDPHASDQQHSETQPRPSEQVKGSAAGDQPSKPPRQPGKLPLPD
jgi:hypothetical protein